MTLQGIAQAYQAGTSLQLTSTNPGDYESFTSGVHKDSYRVLENLLTDGNKASFTLFNLRKLSSESTCSTHSNIRTVQPHWKFGDSQNL